MDFLNNITKETIIITSNKTGVLNEISNQKKLINVKLMTISEFRKRYYFDYDEKSIYYLMNKYNIKYEVSCSYLKNLIYITKDSYKNKKLKFLNTLKQELDAEKLLITDNLFLKYLKNKNIIVLDNILSLFDKNMLQEVSNLCEIKYLNMLNPIYNHETYVFDTIEEEVEYVAYKISELIHAGTSISKIKLTNVNQKYFDTINKIFGFYNLKIDLGIKVSIYSTEICKEFLENLKNDKEESLNNIKQYAGTYIYNKIVDLLNDLVWVNDLILLKPLLIEKIKEISIEPIKQTNLIEVVDYMDYIFSDENVFMLNFNNDSIPKVFKDEDYITDNMKDEVICDKTVDKNMIHKTVAINIIKSIKNLTITCKRRTFDETYYPSLLIEEFPLKETKTNNLISYSEIGNKLKLAECLDNFEKYGISTEQTSLLYSNYKIPYKFYDNSFGGLDKNELASYLNNKLYLSYSSLDIYNKCSFRYYLSNILKLDIYEESFSAYIGSLFHYVLQKCLAKNNVIEEEIKNFINSQKRELTKKETFYVKKLTKELYTLMEFLNEQLKYTSLLDFMFEQKISIEKKKTLNVEFTGIIDKIMYKEFEDKIVMSLIDYKTYNVETDLRLMPFGLNMQLPVYLYLSKKLMNKKIVYSGFYTEQILNNTIKKEDNLYKLNGYSNSDKEVLTLFDSTYNDSLFIKSLKTKQDGDFTAYSKVLNSKQIENIIDITDKIIDNTIENIEKAKFDINPKTITQNISCEFCDFKDICFKSEKDIIYLKPEKDLSFLGGDIDA